MKIQHRFIRRLKTISITSCLLLSMALPMANAAPLVCGGTLNDVRYGPEVGHVIAYFRTEEGAGPSRVLVFCQVDPVIPDGRRISPRSCEHVYDTLVTSRVADQKLRLVLNDEIDEIFNDANSDNTVSADERVCTNLKNWASIESAISSVDLQNPF